MAKDSDGSRLLKRPKCDSTDGQACAESKKARLEHGETSTLPAVVQPTGRGEEGNGLNNRAMGWNSQFGEASFGTQGEPVIDTPPLSPKSTSRTTVPPTDYLPDPSEMDIQALFATLTPEVEMNFEDLDALWKPWKEDLDGVLCYTPSIDGFSNPSPLDLSCQNGLSANLKAHLEHGVEQVFTHTLPGSPRLSFGHKYQAFSYAGSDDAHSSYAESGVGGEISIQDWEFVTSRVDDDDTQEASCSASPEVLFGDIDTGVGEDDEWMS